MYAFQLASISFYFKCTQTGVNEMRRKKFGYSALGCPSIIILEVCVCQISNVLPICLHALNSSDFKVGLACHFLRWYFRTNFQLK